MPGFCKRAPRGVPVAVKLAVGDFRGAAAAAPDAANSQRGTVALLQEAQVLGRVQHPNIVRCHGGCITADSVFIVEVSIVGACEHIYACVPLGIGQCNHTVWVVGCTYGARVCRRTLTRRAWHGICTAVWLQRRCGVRGPRMHGHFETSSAIKLARNRALAVTRVPQDLMETSLMRLMKSYPSGVLPLPATLKIALDIASGLFYLHPTIVHCGACGCHQCHCGCCAILPVLACMLVGGVAGARRL